MKLIKILSFFMLTQFGVFVWGQTDTFVVNTVRTSLHKPIPGTRIFMELPSKDIEFMENMSIVFFPHSNLTVFDISMMNYFEISPSLTKEELNRQGVIISDYKECLIHGRTGKLIFVDGNSEKGSDILLIFGDSTQTIRIEANYEYKNNEERLKLIKLFQSIYFDPNMAIQSLDDAPFTIEITDSSFHYANYTTNSYFFNQSGNKKIDINSEPFFMIGLIPRTASFNLDDYNRNFPGMLKQFGFAPEQIGGNKTININGVEARESIYEFYARGKKRQVYCMMMLKGELCIFFMGISFYDYEKYMQDYRTIASTIKYK